MCRTYGLVQMKHEKVEYSSSADPCLFCQIRSRRELLRRGGGAFIGHFRSVLILKVANCR